MADDAETLTTEEAAGLLLTSTKTILTLLTRTPGTSADRAWRLLRNGLAEDVCAGPAHPRTEVVAA